MPYPDASFDVATASTVLSSVLDAAIRKEILAEMRRVVRGGGLVVVYDFVIRNPRNRSVIAMPTSRLAEAAGMPPDGSERLSPLVYLVAAGASADRDEDAPRRTRAPVAPATPEPDDKARSVGEVEDPDRRGGRSQARPATVASRRQVGPRAPRAVRLGTSGPGRTPGTARCAGARLASPRRG